MQDFLAKGAAWLAAQRREHCAQNVEYEDPTSGSSLRVPATIGRSLFEVDQGDGAMIQSESRDFIVAELDLKLDGLVTVPQPGHRITDGDGAVFEVMDFGSEPCWRWVDGYRTDRRIHTKRVAGNK